MARRKINEWNKMQAMPQRSVYDQRMAELDGTTGEGFGRTQIIPSKLTDFLQMTNVLGDEAFVRSQLERGHRNELREQMHDVAEILGLRTEQKLKTSKNGRRILAPTCMMIIIGRLTCHAGAMKCSRRSWLPRSARND